MLVQDPRLRTRSRFHLLDSLLSIRPTPHRLGVTVATVTMTVTVDLLFYVFI